MNSGARTWSWYLDADLADGYVVAIVGLAMFDGQQVAVARLRSGKHLGYYPEHYVRLTGIVATELLPDAVPPASRGEVWHMYLSK